MPRTAKDLHDYINHPSTLLPEQKAVEEAVETIRLSHEKGGSTFSLYFGDAAQQKLYAVSIYPDRAALVPGKPIPATLLKTFVRANDALLQDPRNAVGTWYNREEDATYLDVTTLLIARADAAVLAEQYNQIAIYDLARQAEIIAGGTGVELKGLPPLRERLPILRRGKQRKHNG